MNRYFWRIFQLVNKIFIKGFRADGWCYAAYNLNKNGIHIIFGEDDEWIELPKNPISAWKGAFIYKFEVLE